MISINFNYKHIMDHRFASCNKTKAEYWMLFGVLVVCFYRTINLLPFSSSSVYSLPIGVVSKYYSRNYYCTPTTPTVFRNCIYKINSDDNLPLVVFIHTILAPVYPKIRQTFDFITLATFLFGRR